MKTAAVAACKAEHSLQTLLQIAGLARSTFFYQQARSREPDRHADTADAIRAIFVRTKGRYGHRRIHAGLRRTGPVAKKTVLALMRRHDMVCLVRRDADTRPTAARSARSQRTC